jgi:hypothetical protein
VVDPGPGFEPQPVPSRRDASSGWGLAILAQIASRWGVETEPRSRVWFELDNGAAAKL